MKKIFTLFILFFSFSIAVFAQFAYNKTFQLDTNTHFPQSEFYSVVEDGKFIYVLGEYQQFATSTLHSINHVPISFLLTLDQNGNVFNQIDFKQPIGFNNLAPIENDGFALMSSNETDSLFLIKVYPLSDTAIEIKKALNLSPNYFQYGRVTTTTDKHFLVSGVVRSGAPNYGSGETYMKLDTLGNVIWKYDTIVNYPDGRRGLHFIELKNGNYLFVGIRDYKDITYNDYEVQGFFKIVDTSGNVLSTTYTDNNRLLLFFYAVSLNDGNLLLAGSERLTPSSNSFEYRGYICKYDSIGQLLWEYSLDKEFDRSGKIIGLDDGSCIVTGVREDTIQPYVIGGQIDSVKYNGFLLKLAADGTKLWERKFSIFDSIYYAERYLIDVTQATNGDFISVGRIMNVNNHPSPQIAGWLIRTDSFGCIVPGCQILDNTENQIFDEKNQLTVYPNPTTDQITFKFEKPLAEGSIMIFNTLGQRVFEVQNIDYQERFDCSMWQKGIYFYGIYEKGRLLKTGQFLKQ